MILVDTSIWIDHLRTGDAHLKSLLNEGQVITHPYIIGELALGNLQQREVIIDSLNNLTCSAIASDFEVLAFINQNQLYGLGVGYVDAHLLASARLTPGVQLWTRDKRLRMVANQLGLKSNFEY